MPLNFDQLLRSGIAVVALALFSAPNVASAPGQPPNVLFIAIDDLRNDLGAFGVAHAKTPHLDRFADESRFFTRHFVQVPTCGASRCALLSGRYPRESAQVGNNAILETQEDWQERSLPAWFRHQGYRTLALGKISHYPGGQSGPDWVGGAEELPNAWSRHWVPTRMWETPQGIMHGYANGVPRTRGETPPMQAFDGPDEAFPDWGVASDAVETLSTLAQSDEPWFFAVGFFKPHLPFVAPKRCFDLHEVDEIPAPEVTERPDEPSSWHGSGELMGNYAHGGRDPREESEYAAQLRLGYAAGCSFVDDQVGRVLGALRESGASENTVVVIWSDHGFLLGEHAIWGKHCLYESALRSPLMISYPGLPQAGEGSDAIVETVDLFPTLIDICGLPQPSGLDGESLRPQLEDPAAASNGSAFGFWKDGKRTVRTPEWRLIEHPGSGPGAEAGYELFHVESDPNEAKNVAEAFPEVIHQLRSMMAANP